MGSMEQMVRIAFYTVGGYLLGDGIADSEMGQQAIGAATTLLTFAWWYWRNRKAA